jgi:ABC-type Mn2+/Zn2+ transport system ATPase subunit
MRAARTKRVAPGLPDGYGGCEADRVRLDALSYRYHRGDPWVVDAVDAAVAGGDVVVVEGANGIGKSTLLQLIVGVLQPTAGRVIDRPPMVGWVPERFPADQPFTVSRYLDAVAGMRGLRGPAAARAVAGWTDRLGIAGFRATRLPDLSKGTAQKVGLVQALLVPPQLLVLDEPWEGLDADARDLVPTLVSEVAAAGGIVLVSDHRGEAGWLPGAARWRLTAAGFATEPAVAGEMCTIEVSVAASSAPAAVALLRAAGHDRVRVRSGADR